MRIPVKINIYHFEMSTQRMTRLPAFYAITVMEIA